jgi:alcohol dehydrogenase class IV
LGAFFPVPHGVVCGTLVAAATEMNIRALCARLPASPALEKYAQIGCLLNGRPSLSREEAWKTLVQTLSEWTQRMEIPRLGAYGIQESDIPRIVANCRGSSMKTNPIELADAEVQEVLMQRL